MTREAWSSRSDAVVAAIAALATRHRPPQSHLRVVVGPDPSARLATPYLDVQARVVGRSDEVGEDRRYHATLRPGPLELPEPHRPDDADLVLLAGSGTQPLDTTLRGVATALAAGGIAVVAVPAGERPLEAWCRAAGLTLLERAGVPVGAAGDLADVLVVADPRPPVPLPADAPRLNRSTCVDRSRVLDALTRPPWAGPVDARASGSSHSLVDALHRQLERGEPDLRELPWPRLGSTAPPREAAGCDVLALMPHPDDESVYAGGTLAGLSAAGRRVRLVVATDGAGGRGGTDLARRRARELLEASHALGITGLRCLAWSDFGKYRDPARTDPVTAGDALRTWGLDRSLAALVAEIRHHRPERLLSLDPGCDPNLSLHGHHLGLGVLVALAFHAAADPDFSPQLGPAWACAEHRVMAPRLHARWGDTFEVDREAKRRALLAHRSQAYSTAAPLAALDDPEHAAVEVSRSLQSRAPRPWVLARGRRRPDLSEDWATRARRVLRLARPRAAVVAALREQAARGPRDEAVEDSLRALAADDAVAVVTGQQVGLLGGPVYTLAKALGAVALARRLRRDGIRAVPVFWLASQDHDLDEVQRVPRLDAPALSLGLSPDRGPVGTRPLGSNITALLDRWEMSLPLPALDVVAQLRRTHEPERDFTGAFVALLREVTRGTGLLTLDPADPAIARLAGPWLRRAAAQAPAVAEALARATERRGSADVVPVRAGYSQVFWVDDDGFRQRLTHEPGAPVDAEQVHALERHPERGSAAALLRPIIQDALLPTIAYVAGPTERRYLDQLDELYAWAGVPAPRVVARPALHLASSHDAEALREAGGIERLRRSARPLESIGRAALDAANRAWLDATEAVLATIDAGRARERPRDASMLRELREGWARVEGRAHDAITTATESRTARNWSTIRADIGSRLDAVERQRSARALTRARHSIARLRRSLLRDGRRARPRALAAWRRVGAAPPERRMTVAEWFARGGPPRAADLLPALDTYAEVSISVGGRS